MRAQVLALSLALAVPGVVAAQRGTGAIRSVTPNAQDNQPGILFTVRGVNPCGAVQLDFGDGAIQTFPISGLPATVRHDYRRAGTYRVVATGMGNCQGEVSANIRVTPAEASGIGSDGGGRFGGLDRNNDGRITRDEWRGANQSFENHDWNGDGVLTGHEASADAFDALDGNRDGRVTVHEWPGTIETYRALDTDRNSVLSRAEVEVDDAAFADERDAVRGTFNPQVARRGATVNVDGKVRWTDSGINVMAGDMLTFRATGIVRMGPDEADPRGSLAGRTAGGSPLPSALAGALIARVEDSAPFLIGGRSGAIRMPRDGRLYLSVNDDHLPDNSGQFQVTIMFAR